MLLSLCELTESVPLALQFADIELQTLSKVANTGFELCFSLCCFVLCELTESVLLALAFADIELQTLSKVANRA